MSPVASFDDAILDALARSLTEETPRRRTRPGITVTARRLPLLPLAPSGVSRDDIMRRLRPYGVTLTRPEVDAAVARLVERGLVARGPNGYARVRGAS